MLARAFAAWASCTGEEFVAAKAGAQEEVDEVAGDAAWQW